MMSEMEIGENVVVSVKGDKLTITVDLSEDLGLSGSGKSRVISTTRGIAVVPGTNYRVGLNVFVPIDDRKKRRGRK